VPRDNRLLPSEFIDVKVFPYNLPHVLDKLIDQSSLFQATSAADRKVGYWAIQQEQIAK